MRLRSVVPAPDMAALEHLFDTIRECDGHSPIGEHKYLDLLHAEDTVTGLVGENAEGLLVAYVALSTTQQPGTWAMELAVHPLNRSRREVRQLIDAGVEQVRAAGGDHVRIWAFQPNFAEFLEEAGFEPERELRQLRRPLPVGKAPEFPAGVEVRPFLPGIDDDVWLEVNNAAFADHPENGAWTREVLEDRKEQPWFEPDGFRMAWESSKLVGFCWTKMHSDLTGEIYVIGVSPGEQGRGLGKALTLEGLRYLAEAKGAETAMLYVDSDNTKALRMYGRLGFRLDHVDRSLVRRLVS